MLSGCSTSWIVYQAQHFSPWAIFLQISFNIRPLKELHCDHHVSKWIWSSIQASLDFEITFMYRIYRRSAPCTIAIHNLIFPSCGCNHFSFNVEYTRNHAFLAFLSLCEFSLSLMLNCPYKIDRYMLWHQSKIIHIHSASIHIHQRSLTQFPLQINMSWMSFINETYFNSFNQTKSLRSHFVT